MTTKTNDLIPKLRQYRATLGDGRDCRSDRERADHTATCITIERTISGLLQGPDDAKAAAWLADLTARRQAVLDKDASLLKEISAAPDPRTLTKGRDRDRAHDHREHLRRQRTMLREGSLLAAPGVVYERLDYLDAEITRWTARRDGAQRAFDACVQQAQELLKAAATTA